MKIPLRTAARQHGSAGGIALVIGLAFLLRTGLMLVCDGYEFDTNCFAAWADNMVQYGAGGFYTGGFFADYPPGYLYWLWLGGWLCRLLGIPTGSVAGLYLLGGLTLLCDLALALLAFGVARRLGQGRRDALWALALVAFSPVLIFNIAVWKQVDSVLSLALVGCFLLLGHRRWYGAAVLYAIALLIKPQALILGPVLALGYLAPLLGSPTTRNLAKALLQTAASALLCVGCILLGAYPFQGTQGALWLPKRYLDTLGGYPYACINAFNLFGALGGNWKPYAQGWLLPYSTWGALLILGATLFIIGLAYRACRKGTLNLPLLAGLFGLLVFTFGHGMHERYSLPFLLLLFFGWLFCRDRQLLVLLGVQSLLTLGNSALALWGLENDIVYGSARWGLLLRMGGMAQVITTLWLVFCCWGILGDSKGHSRRLGLLPRMPLTPCKRPPFWAEQLPWNRRDLLFLLLPTLLCAGLSFARLGSTQVPQTTWSSGSSQTVEISFEQPTQVAQIWVYSGISEGSLELVAAKGSQPLATLQTSFDNMYRWQIFEAPFEAEQLELHGFDAVVNELLLVDEAGQTLQPSSISPGGKALFDEQGLRPSRPSSYTGMYFDELYHARTAYEHLQGLQPYENSHPPLGKLLIAGGIGLFGMNPFGWRFMGTLFGVLLLPLLYLLGRALLGSREYALLGAGLLGVDFMRFTQSRIGTIDTFAVFFILASYYFMLCWLRQEPYATPLRRQLLPLGLSGLCFGLASSVKWVGVYAGFGLAVLFFLRLWQGWRAAAPAHRPRRALQLLGLGTLFFALLAPAVYLLSYLPYFLCTQHPYSLEEVWGLQGFMLSYHSQLTATHPFESRWYSWPLLLRPIWYSMGEALPAGVVSSIALLGNPAIWWSGAVAVVLLMVAGLRRSRDQAVNFLLIAFFSQLLPWVFITRATFLYHYFPALPFVILALCWVLQRHCQGRPHGWLLPIGLFLVSLILLIGFYPALSDLPVSTDYAGSLLWLPGWSFYWLP